MPITAYVVMLMSNHSLILDSFAYDSLYDVNVIKDCPCLEHLTALYGV